MSERRYGDEELREILSLATTGDTREQALPAETGGLTLGEIQRIGQEVGIDPGRIAQAAAALDARGQSAPVRKSMGLPVGVSRVVDLPRAPTDREWELLVAEFRSTFGVQGRINASGGLRDWSVGNLHISIEPTERGEQLRLSTRKDNALALNRLSVVLSGMSLVFGTVVAMSGDPAKAVVIFGMFAGMAAFAYGMNLMRMPGWARERSQQMESLAERAVKLLSKPIA